MSLFHRRGKFRVPAPMLTFDQEAVRAIMAACIVVRCERLFVNDVFEYVAMSPHFDAIKSGIVAPEYEWHITRNSPLEELTVQAIKL